MADSPKIIGADSMRNTSSKNQYGVHIAAIEVLNMTNLFCKFGWHWYRDVFTQNWQVDNNLNKRTLQLVFILKCCATCPKVKPVIKQQAGWL